MGCGTVSLKGCLALISLFFWICAVGLIVLGSYILVEYGKIQELASSTDILVPSTILIGAGVFLFIVGLLGCVGGMKGSKPALAVFFILMLVVLVGEVLAMALGYHYSGDIQDKLTNKMHNMTKKCILDPTSVDCDELNFIQSHFECCGSDNYTDWFKWSVNGTNSTVPSSCCKHSGCLLPDKDTNSTIAAENIYTQGCADKAINEFNDQFMWIAVGCIVLAVLQTLGLVSACIMLCRSKETPYSQLDSQGYRV